MNRRTWVIALVVLLLLVVGISSWKQRRSARSMGTIVPPTGQELALPPLQSLAPVMEPAAAVAVAAPAPVMAPAPAIAPAVESAMDAAVRARRFWGNRGYTTKDRQYTYLSDAQRQALKAEWLSGSP